MTCAGMCYAFGTRCVGVNQVAESFRSNPYPSAPDGSGSGRGFRIRKIVHFEHPALRPKAQLLTHIDLHGNVR